MLGTAIATPFIAPVEGLAGAAGVGAGIGALSGADAAPTVADLPGNVAQGAGTGALLGSAAHGVGEAAKWAAPKMLAGITSKGSTADIQSYLNNPDAIDSALDPAQRGPAVAAAATGIGKEAGELSQKAKGLLNPDSSPVSVDSLSSLVDQVKQQFLQNGVPKSGPAESAIKALDDQMGRIKLIAAQNDGKLTEPAMQAQIKELQGIASSVFGDSSDTASAKGALGDLSGALNRSLKAANPAYGEAMVPTAQKTGLASDLADQFKLDNAKGGGYQASDTTNSKINAAMNELKPEGGSLFDRVNASTGQDLQDAMTKSQTKENLNAPGAGGPLKLLMTALGYGAGHNAGVPMGGIAGAAAGRAASEGINGGAVAKWIMNAHLGRSTGMGGQIAGQIDQAVQKFGPILVNAAKQGGNELAATHFVLATSNPEYQGLMDHVQGDNAQDDGSHGYHP